jgi:hypothetical protein
MLAALKRLARIVERSNTGNKRRALALEKEPENLPGMKYAIMAVGILRRV